jgi:hypothetical protein
MSMGAAVSITGEALAKKATNASLRSRLALHPYGGNGYSPDHFGGRFRLRFFFQEHPLISVDVFKV